ncbi:hypothetical protein B046DRAFT_03372 [Streptomyces sp. LamerLS-316]|nr:hypothetical protein B046DRAFT_03372 [Streptomyces sp. LamerLS-316]
MRVGPPRFSGTAPVPRAGPVGGPARCQETVRASAAVRPFCQREFTFERSVASG